MDLRTYLWKYNIQSKDFAKLLECAPSYFSQIYNNRRIPSRTLALKIEELTKGLVRASQFKNKPKVKKFLSQKKAE